MKRKRSKPKICFAASTGGHFEQLMMLRPLMERYDCFILAEKTIYDVKVKDIKVYYLNQINRKEKGVILKLLLNSIYSLKLLFKENPDIIITTGVLAMIPICIIGKLFGKKLIYIESFAKVTSPTQSGKFLYHFADYFYVQWKDMLTVFPKAIFKGGVY